MTELTCYNHPNRPTLLRCNNCERPICASCAIRTPTGYRCPECVRGQQKVFDTAQWYDYVSAFFVAAVLSGIASVLASLITSIIWGIFVIGLGPLAGATIGNVARRFVKGRHSKALNWIFIAGVVAGTLPMLFLTGLGGLINMLFYGQQDTLGGILGFQSLLWQIVYLILAVPAAYSQFSGLFFRR
ncbi:MAG: B-box zinc finger protein [Chloroflexota bacterium]